MFFCVLCFIIWTSSVIALHQQKNSIRLIRIRTKKRRFFFFTIRTFKISLFSSLSLSLLRMCIVLVSTIETKEKKNIHTHTHRQFLSRRRDPASHGKRVERVRCDLASSLTHFKGEDRRGTGCVLLRTHGKECGENRKGRV